MTLSHALPLSGLLTAILLAGCGSSTTSGGTTIVIPPVIVATVHGTVANGSLPLQGVSVQLYTVGTSGVRSASTAMLAAALSTDATGAFSFPVPSCGSATEVYLVATGGANSATALLSAIGPCSSLTASSNLRVNEATTVASVFALAPFLADATHLGATGANPVGLVNAFTLVHSLVDTTAGTVPGAALAANVTAPTATIDTLANLLAGCVQAASSTATACSSLLTATAATDTLGVTLQIARQPAAFASLYALASANASYSPSLPVAPSDWTLALRIAASGLATPYGVAIDAAGNAWVANESAATVSELSPSGALLATVSGTGILAARALSIDRTGNVWVAGTGADAVVKLSSAGTILSSTAIAGGAPSAIANDSAGNAWVANADGSTVTEISSAGAVLTTIAGFNDPTGLVVDAVGNVWVANAGAGNVLQVSHSGAIAGAFADGVTQAPTALAIDGSANLWFSGSIPSPAAVQGAVGQISGANVASAPIVSATNIPGAIAVAGGDIWIVNGTATGGLLLFRAGGTAPVSVLGSLNTPSALAVDASGNVWTTNAGDNTLSLFLGLTTPVATPLSVTSGP